MRELDDYAEDFWAWRAVTMPRSRDDVVRLTRPPGWLPQVGLDAVAAQRAARDGFAARLAPLVQQALRGADTADGVDAALLRSALARVTWELDVVRTWAQPSAYLDAALGPVFDVLLPLGVDAARVAEVTRYLRHVPAVVDAAGEVLPGHAQSELAQRCAGELDGVRARLDAVVAALTGSVDLDPAAEADLRSAAEAAATACEDLRGLLAELAPSLPPWRGVGRTAFEGFLRDVACVPLGVDDLLALGVREHQRAVVAERLERHRARDVPLPPLPADAAAQCAAQAVAQAQVREFLAAEGLLDHPDSLRRYLNAPLPAHLEPLRFLGVADDLGSAEHSERDAVSYVPAPSADLPYFYAANALDPRAGVVHEGVHADQLALSWRHPRPVRRHYYDSGAGEGIAFYHEEMALAAGLFDDAPHTRVTLHSFMRLRALRVQVDVGLATGALSIDAAAHLLRTQVPVDAATAAEEAASFAQTPGQAMTYQVGKTQVLALLADASAQRPDLTLGQLHDRLWLEGNVPIALQRWELLGATDELAAIGIEVEA